MEENFSLLTQIERISYEKIKSILDANTDINNKEAKVLFDDFKETSRVLYSNDLDFLFRDVKH